MANPDPKALQEAATKLADQAKASRQAIGAEYTKTITDQRTADDEARVKLATAQTEVKTREDLLKHRQEQLQKEQKEVADTDRRADEAQKAGDTRLATELKEEADIGRTSATGFTNDIQQAQRELSDARVAVAERQRDVEHSEQRLQEIRDAHNAAEHQLDAMENKASMMDEAARKLALAATLDNPVERADAELAAEKLLKDAGGIQVDAAAVTRLTGQELQIPDVSALPVADATPAGDATGDATADTTGAGAADTTADAGAPGHLLDDFGTVTSGDGGSANADGAATTDGGATPDGAGTDAGDTAIAGLGDPAGGDVAGGSAPDLTAAPDPLGIDATAPVTDAGSGLDAGTGAGVTVDPASDGSDGDGAATDPGFAGPDPQLDPASDPGAAATDSFADFGADPAATDPSATAGDDLDA